MRDRRDERVLFRRCAGKLCAALLASLGLVSPVSAASVVNSVTPVCRPHLMNEELARAECTGTGCPLNFHRYRECLQSEFKARVKEAEERLEAIAKIKSDLDEKAEFLAGRRICPPEADVEALRKDFIERVARLRRIVPEIRTLKGLIVDDMRIDISEAFAKGLLGETLERWLRWVPIDEQSFDVWIEPLERKSWELDELEEDIKTRIVMPADCEPPSDGADEDLLLGTWKPNPGTCDQHRRVTFERCEAFVPKTCGEKEEKPDPCSDEFVGRYTGLGGLGKFHFEADDIGYEVHKTAEGTYEGCVLWRWETGEWKWQPTTITIDGDAFSDTASDPCSKTMTRE